MHNKNKKDNVRIKLYEAPKKSRIWSFFSLSGDLGVHECLGCDRLLGIPNDGSRKFECSYCGTWMNLCGPSPNCDEWLEIKKNKKNKKNKK